MKLPVGTKNRWTTELHLTVAIVMTITFTTAYQYSGDRPWALLIVILSISLFMLVRYAFPKKILRLFQRGKIDGILKHYRRTARLSARSELRRAYTRSLALCFFGKFKESEAEIKGLLEFGLPPTNEGMQLNAAAANFYLRKVNPEAGLEASIRASEIMAVGGQSQSARIRKNVYDAYVEIGMILTGKADKQAIWSLEKRFGSSEFLLKLMIAWCLCRHYKDSEQGSVEYYAGFLKRNAKFCVPLQDY